MSRWLDSLWYPDSAGGGPEARAPAVARGALKAAAAGFGAAVRVRNALYAAGVLPTEKIDGARVVSVGNLNVGGAGKTPAVIFLAQWARACGRSVAVLSRGYGREAMGDRLVRGDALLPALEVGDEPRLIAARLGDVPVLVGPDRARLARAARAEHGADFILLDDGLQHRRLARDVDVVVVDGEAGFGNGKLLPYGPLREPPEALERAHLVWLREGGGAAPPALPEEKVVRVRHEARGVLAPDGASADPRALAGRKVVAFAGIARPAAFFRAVRAAGGDVVAERAFPDHHSFTEAELGELQALAGAEARMVTTEKDLQRLPPGFGAWALRLEVTVVAGGDRLAAALGLDPARLPC